MFSEFSVNFRQTAGDSYLNKDPTTLVSPFLSLSFKICQDLIVTEFEVHTAFGRSIRLWTDLGLTNQIAGFSLVFQ